MEISSAHGILLKDLPHPLFSNRNTTETAIDPMYSLWNPQFFRYSYQCISVRHIPLMTMNDISLHVPVTTLSTITAQLCRDPKNMERRWCEVIAKQKKPQMIGYRFANIRGYFLKFTQRLRRYRRHRGCRMKNSIS